MEQERKMHLNSHCGAMQVRIVFIVPLMTSSLTHHGNKKSRKKISARLEPFRTADF
jgi:hypothetical protein